MLILDISKLIKYTSKSNAFKIFGNNSEYCFKFGDKESIILFNTLLFLISGNSFKILYNSFELANVVANTDISLGPPLFKVIL